MKHGSALRKTAGSSTASRVSARMDIRSLRRLAGHVSREVWVAGPRLIAQEGSRRSRSGSEHAIEGRAKLGQQYLAVNRGQKLARFVTFSAG
jgi:hypothetical protein